MAALQQELKETLESRETGTPALPGDAQDVKSRVTHKEWDTRRLALERWTKDVSDHVLERDDRPGAKPLQKLEH
jgi:hypothetical protein